MTREIIRQIDCYRQMLILLLVAYTKEWIACRLDLIQGGRGRLRAINCFRNADENIIITIMRRITAGMQMQRRLLDKRTV